MKITNEELIEDLKKVANICSKIPTDKDYIKHGKFNRVTVQRRFGSWNNALQLIWGKINKTRGEIRICHPCKTCGKPTKNYSFCSHSCAATFNNSKYPKRKKQLYKCQRCGKLTRRLNICPLCDRDDCLAEYGKKTLSEFKSTYARHRYQKIRLHAHRVVKLNKIEKTCSVCGYQLNVELCHRKPIHSFPSTATVDEINSLSNLVFLCPNHHLEMEYGYLDSATLHITHKHSNGAVYQS